MAGCMLDLVTFAFRIRVTVKEYEKRTAARSNKRKWQQRSGIQALFANYTIHHSLLLLLAAVHFSYSFTVKWMRKAKVAKSSMQLGIHAFEI